MYSAASYFTILKYRQVIKLTFNKVCIRIEKIVDETIVNVFKESIMFAFRNLDKFLSCAQISVKTICLDEVAGGLSEVDILARGK